MATKKKLSRKDKAYRNSWQTIFYQKYANALNQSEFEIYLNSMRFLQNIHYADGKMEQLKNDELSKCVYLLFISRYMEALNKELKGENSQSDREIDTSALYVGQIVKNFNELCKLLNIKPPSGKRQREQYRTRFKRFFDFAELDYSNNIVILEIYPVSADKKQTYSGKFIQEMQYILLNHLIQVASSNPELIDDDGYMEYKTTYYQLLNTELKLISPYIKERIKDKSLMESFFMDKAPEMFNDLNETKYILSFLYNKLYDKVKCALSTALKKLNRIEEMISLEELYIVKVLDSSGTNWTWKEVRLQKDKTYIMNTRKVIANRLGCKNSWECLYSGKKAEFEKLFFEKVKHDKGWLEVRFRVSIGFNINHILAYIGDYTDVVTYQKILNDNLALSLNQSATKAYMVDNAAYLQKRADYIKVEKEYSARKDIELQEDFDKTYSYLKKYSENFPKQVDFMSGYIVNPSENETTEIVSYRNNMMGCSKVSDDEILWDELFFETDI